MGDICFTQGERLLATCGEVTFALSLERWRGFAHTSIGGDNGRSTQRKREKCFQVESSIGKT